MNPQNSNQKCTDHPDRDASGTCTYCGKPVCEECNVSLAGNCYCKPCADLAFTHNRGLPAGWFSRHLNWTVVLTWAGAVAVSFVAGFIVGLVLYGSDNARTEEIAALAGYVAALAWLLITNGWVLRKKGRSEWHLLLLLFPLGFLFLLAVGNKGQPIAPAKPPAS